MSIDEHGDAVINFMNAKILTLCNIICVSLGLFSST